MESNYVLLTICVFACFLMSPGFFLGFLVVLCVMMMTTTKLNKIDPLCLFDEQSYGNYRNNEVDCDDFNMFSNDRDPIYPPIDNFYNESTLYQPDFNLVGPSNGRPGNYPIMEYTQERTVDGAFSRSQPQSPIELANDPFLFSQQQTDDEIYSRFEEFKSGPELPMMSIFGQSGQRTAISDMFGDKEKYTSCYTTPERHIHHSDPTFNVGSNMGFDEKNSMYAAQRQRDKRALDGVTSKNMNYFKRHFSHELDQAENKRWWGNQDY